MNWSNVISSLEQHGLNRGEIAQECNCSLSLINALAQGKRGRRISYEIGTALVALQAKSKKPTKYDLVKSAAEKRVQELERELMAAKAALAA